MSRSDPLTPPPEFLAGLDRGPQFEGSPAIPKTTTRPPAPIATLPRTRQPGIAATPPGPPQPLMVLLGTPVVLHLRHGEMMRGTLVKLFTYELLVRTSDGKDAIVMKHGIDWIEPAGGE
jgi:hypothetical protein